MSCVVLSGVPFGMGICLAQKALFSINLSPRWWVRWAQAYPELAAAQKNIETVLKAEEERFAETLETGMGILNQSISRYAG